jgi:hypothetical protein
MSIAQIAREELSKVRDTISHKDLISTVAFKTGYNKESVRGTIIKQNFIKSLDGFNYEQCHFIKSNKPSKIKVNYNDENKLNNWKHFKNIIGVVPEMVTLAGEDGYCIRTFKPFECINYEKDIDILNKFRSQWGNSIQSKHADVFSHTKSTYLMNLDLMGYLCGSLFKNLYNLNDINHKYILLTIQKQMGLRNYGNWVNIYKNKYKVKDQNLPILKECLYSYKLIENRFYKREGIARSMRTTLWIKK